MPLVDCDLWQWLFSVTFYTVLHQCVDLLVYCEERADKIPIYNICFRVNLQTLVKV